MDTVFKAVKSLLIEEPFYGIFIMGLNKRFDQKIETAAVGIDGINPVLLINKDFWYQLSADMQKAILKHECCHLLFQHLSKNWDYLDKQDSKTTNMAMDCEVNSYIPQLQREPWCYPDRFGLENNKGTLYYFEQLMSQNSSESPSSGNSSGNSPGNSPNGTLVDDHSLWGEVTDAQGQLVQQQIDFLTKNTVEQIRRGQGTIPGQFKEYIDSLFEIKPRLFDWKSFLRRYLGSILDIELKKTRKRESHRFPGSAGLRHKKKTQILVVVDTSGSISANDLCDFFSEIHHIHKAGAVVDIIEIDTKIQRHYRYNGKWDMSANGRGGTILTEAINYFNANRRDYSSCVIFTDGYCAVDFKIYGDAMWIIATGGAVQKYPGKTIYINSEQK